MYRLADNICYCFFVDDNASTEIYTYGHTLTLHDALPISMKRLLTGLATASLLIGVPLAAAAHDRDDHRRGWERHGNHGHWNKHAYHHDYRPDRKSTRLNSSH